jgi:GNAT superfamily N-acetyltransferase
MDNEIIIRELGSHEPAWFRQAWVIYEGAFPEEERVSEEALLEAIRRRERADEESKFHFQVALEDGQVAGIAIFNYYPQTRMGFIPYLAVDPRRRNGGLGARLYRHLVATVASDGQAEGPALGVTFEVERPELGRDPASQELRQRRIGFYQRNGALIVPQIYFVAPPMRPDLPEMPYVLMLHPLTCSLPLGRPEIEAVLTTVLCFGYELPADTPYLQRAWGG